jgi:acyl CoA:acetate/3-ketoacid CoA transferase alpha subunit
MLDVWDGRGAAWTHVSDEGGTTSPPRSKVRTAAEAVAAVRPGHTLTVGGFGLVGAPLSLIEALGAHAGARELTIISNNLGEPGVGGFFTKTGLGTPLTEGCEERVIRGERYVFQESRRADVALIRARTADELGNLVYAKTARNFNPDMATAADLVIAEVDEIVPVGTLDPEAVVTPHLFVDVLVVTQKGVRP